ncbi:MAG TPA: capsular polysaccharide synthesis protein [Candidatus Coprenecus merdipullorum]|nr:capsular polysaccharide synthesis protein [Candidatus Coprenecus merdipullorum]
MNLRRINVHLHIALYGHILNWLWLPDSERRRRRGDAVRDAVLAYLQQYVPYISDIPEDGPAGKEPERMFSIWLQGEENAPPIVKACFRSMRRHSRQELVVLDSSSMSDWIDLPGYIMDKWKAGKIRPAHFSDICRTELLYRHGGVWMDATDFMTSPVPDSIMNQDFFIFMSGESVFGAYAFVQNCFFRSRKGNYLLKAWNTAMQAYWKYESSTVDYFVHQLLFRLAVENNPRAAALFARMPRISQDPTHVLWWDYRNRPFCQEEFSRLTAGSFFQKTEYKSAAASSPVPGSFSDIMLRM